MLSIYNTLGSVPSMSVKKNKGQKRGGGSGSTWETKAKPPRIKCHPRIHGQSLPGEKSIKIPHIEIIEKLQFFTANENGNMTKVF